MQHFVWRKERENEQQYKAVICGDSIYCAHYCAPICCRRDARLATRGPVPSLFINFPAETAPPKLGGGVGSRCNYGHQTLKRETSSGGGLRAAWQGSVDATGEGAVVRYLVGQGSGWWSQRPVEADLQRLCHRNGGRREALGSCSPAFATGWIPLERVIHERSRNL